MNVVGRLRTAALIAVLAGAVGSLSFLLQAGRTTPRLLLVIMSLWVLGPFVAVALAEVLSKRWSDSTLTTLHGVMLVLALGSLAAYAANAVSPPRAQAGFAFVVVPLASWLLMAIAVPTAALISRKRH